MKKYDELEKHDFERDMFVVKSNTLIQRSTPPNGSPGSKEADRAAKSFVVERLLALSEKQAAPKRFYSYDTLRGMGISGKADIVPALGELKQRGVTVIFPTNAKRESGKNENPKRGIILCKKEA